MLRVIMSVQTMRKCAMTGRMTGIIHAWGTANRFDGVLPQLACNIEQWNASRSRDSSNTAP